MNLGIAGFRGVSGLRCGARRLGDVIRCSEDIKSEKRSSHTLVSALLVMGMRSSQLLLIGLIASHPHLLISITISHKFTDLDLPRTPSGKISKNPKNKKNEKNMHVYYNDHSIGAHEKTFIKKGLWKDV